MPRMPAPLTVNTTDYELRLLREDLLGYGSLDAKRPAAWRQFGYEEHVTPAMLRQAYERTGAGQGAVHRLLDKCWQSLPRVKKPKSDQATPWEESVGKVLEAVQGWQRIRDWDRRNMIGRYSGLILRVADGRPLREPMGKASRLVSMVPVSEEQLRVQGWDSDPNSETFGQPTMWQYRMRELRPGDQQGRPDEWADVHPSRIVILAEGSAGHFLDGVPLLLAGFNHLVELEKITGGSAESFLKNSARALTINFDAGASPEVITRDDSGAPTTRSVRQVVGEQVDALNRSIDAALVTQGATASTLQTTIADPTKAFEVAACAFAASVRIPFTVLFGQQTGRLASDEDKADMIARATSRRTNELTPAVREVILRLQACGVIDAGEFEIEWPPLDSPGDGEKADLLDKLTTAMQKAFQAGLSEPLFDANELRRVVDYEERADDGMPQEGDPAADPNADPAAAPGAPGLQRVA